MPHLYIISSHFLYTCYLQLLIKAYYENIEPLLLRNVFSIQMFSIQILNSISEYLYEYNT